MLRRLALGQEGRGEAEKTTKMSDQAEQRAGVAHAEAGRGAACPGAACRRGVSLPWWPPLMTLCAARAGRFGLWTPAGPATAGSPCATMCFLAQLLALEDCRRCALRASPAPGRRAARISGSSDETTMIARPSAASALDQVVDLGLGADVDAARRLVEEQDPRAGHDPAADDRLLLVAAAEVARSAGRSSSGRRFEPLHQLLALGRAARAGGRCRRARSAPATAAPRCWRSGGRGTMPSRLRSSGRRPMPGRDGGARTLPAGSALPST